MARSTLTPQTLQGNKVSAYSVAESADITYEATTGLLTTNGDQFVSSGNDIVICRNDQIGAQTITFYTAEDPYGLTDEIATYSIGAGEYAIFGIFQTVPWRQTDGNVYLGTSHADILIAIIAL